MSKKYLYRKYKPFEKSTDTILRPLMVLFEGKDSHWWDWSEFEVTQKNLPWLTLEKDKQAIRKFRKYPLLGQYNFSGLIDLYKTLKVLRKVAVLNPESHKGLWSLIIKRKKETIICNFKHKGAVKSLLDGEASYIGVTENGEYIKLKLVKICDRKLHQELLFI